MTSDGGLGSEGSPLSSTDLRAVFHSVSDAIFVHDEDGDIIDVNRAAVEMYGYSRETLRQGDVGTTSSGVPPYTQENAEKRLERAVEGEEQTFEWQGQDSDGNVFWEEVSLSRTAVDDEVRVLAIVRNIDDRREAKRRFQTLISNLPGIVYRARNEPGWPMDFVGGRCEEVTGYPAAALESGDVSWGEDVLHPDERERLQEAVQTAIEADEPFEVTYRIRTADGEKRWMWERGQQIEVPGRSATVLEGLITDVTERKQYEKRLEEQRDDLDVLNQVLRHDIRNDLQLVVAYADLLAEQITDEDDLEYVETIRDSARHAVELTQTARDTAEMMLASSEERHERDLRAILTDELNEVRSIHTEAVVTADDPLPSVTVRESGMLDSAFRNLLDNAIHHNDKDVPEVTVSATANEGRVVVEIADNGPGVPDDRKEEIFGKGEKGLESRGTGLGLYLVRNLVETHGGDIRVEDNEPEGAVFVVELPTAD